MANERRPVGTADQTPAERARALAEAQVEAEENPRDETVPGGRYVISGTVVNAHGEAVEEPEETRTVRARRQVAPTTVPTGDQPPPNPVDPPPDPPTGETQTAPPAGE